MPNPIEYIAHPWAGHPNLPCTKHVSYMPSRARSALSLHGIYASVRTKGKSWITMTAYHRWRYSTRVCLAEPRWEFMTHKDWTLESYLNDQTTQILRTKRRRTEIKLNARGRKSIFLNLLDQPGRGLQWSTQSRTPGTCRARFGKHN